jgi:Rod binding domain-containing protein
MDGSLDKVNNSQKFYRTQPKNNKALPANRHFIPDEMKKVAESYEKQFAQFLLKEFHKSIPKSQGESTAKDIYEGWMINEQSNAIAQSRDGLGIKDLILDEVYPRKYRNEAAYNSFLQARANHALKARNAYKEMEMKDNEFDSARIKTKSELGIK